MERGFTLSLYFFTPLCYQPPPQDISSHLGTAWQLAVVTGKPIFGILSPLFPRWKSKASYLEKLIHLEEEEKASQALATRCWGCGFANYLFSLCHGNGTGLHFAWHWSPALKLCKSPSVLCRKRSRPKIQHGAAWMLSSHVLYFTHFWAASANPEILLLVSKEQKQNLAVRLERGFFFHIYFIPSLDSAGSTSSKIYVLDRTHSGVTSIMLFHVRK